MKLSKRAALHGYYLATLAWRAARNARRARQGRAPIMLLFYHRVADDHPNDWTMPRATFRRQIDWLQRRFDLVSLEEAQRRIRGPANYRPAVSITFDDGYSDNCDFALPLLIERGIPCTYFVTLHNAVSGEPFPHDAALGRTLKPNSTSELRELAEAGIEIGSHTRTHADLGTIDNLDILHDEISVAGRELGRQIDRSIRYFAFPFGLPPNLNAAGFQLARQCGLQAVCSAYGGYNVPGGDPFHLQRIHADPEMVRFKNWLTVDPRKWDLPAFDYRWKADAPTPNLPDSDQQSSASVPSQSATGSVSGSGIASAAAVAGESVTGTGVPSDHLAETK